MADKSDERGWEGWIEWRLDDGTSSCNFFGGEEVKIDMCYFEGDDLQYSTDSIKCHR